MNDVSSLQCEKRGRHGDLTFSRPQQGGDIANTRRQTCRQKLPVNTSTMITHEGLTLLPLKLQTQFEMG